MSSKNVHLVDIGDDAKGTLCRCLAAGCGWKFQSESRSERLHESYKHLSDAVNS